MEIRNRIKEFCRERGITQKDLADRLGITDVGLNKCLRGGYPQLQTLERIAEVLEVEVWELLASEESIRKHVESGLFCPKCGAKLRLVIDED